MHDRTKLKIKAAHDQKDQSSQHRTMLVTSIDLG